MKLTTRLAVALVVLFTAAVVNAQQETSPPEEKRVALTDVTVAHDGDGTAVLQGNLRTTSLNGGPDDPVTNVRIVVRNTGAISYAFVSASSLFTTRQASVAVKESSKPPR